MKPGRVSIGSRCNQPKDGADIFLLIVALSASFTTICQSSQKNLTVFVCYKYIPFFIRQGIPARKDKRING
jgi:hypothetical protein